MEVKRLTASRQYFGCTTEWAKNVTSAIRGFVNCSWPLKLNNAENLSKIFGSSVVFHQGFYFFFQLEIYEKKRGIFWIGRFFNLFLTKVFVAFLFAHKTLLSYSLSITNKPFTCFSSFMVNVVLLVKSAVLLFFYHSQSSYFTFRYFP